MSNEKCRLLAWGAFRRGHYLLGSDELTKQAATLRAKMLFCREIEQGLHEPKCVLSDHGIEICRIAIERLDDA